MIAILARRQQFHQQVLVPHLTPGDVYPTESLQRLSHALFYAGLSSTDALNQACVRFHQSVVTQAYSLAYIDGYQVFTVGAATFSVLSFLMKGNRPHAPGGPMELSLSKATYRLGFAS